MASLNKVMLIGNLGRDPEVSYTPAGMAIAKIALATTETWNDKATGEKKEKTEWHRVTFFGKQAETVGRYMAKGRQIYVEGRLQTTSYEKDGITRYTTDIIAANFQFLGTKGEGSFQGPNAGGGNYQPNNAPQGGGFQKPNAGFQQPNRPPQNNPNHQPPQPDYDPYGADQGFHQPPDDDIPF